MVVGEVSVALGGAVPAVVVPGEVGKQ